MTSTLSTLHLVCGKIASGKSTLAGALAKTPGTVLISEDDWLTPLFADQMTTGADYVRCSTKLRAAMGPHIAAVLNAGLSVVLDFPANTVALRSWMRDILDQTRAANQLHVLNPPDALCLSRLRARNTAGEHAFAATEAQYWQFAKHFELPTQAEGFTIVFHDPETRP